MNVAFNAPINQVSFGQVSLLLLRLLHKRIIGGTSDVGVYLFPVGGNMTISRSEDETFAKWLHYSGIRAMDSFDRNQKIFKIWHLNGGLESFSKDQTLLSFYELDSPTKAELNVTRNNKTVFTSKYTCDVFRNLGVETSYIPLGFDDFNFSPTGKKYFSDDRITFNIVGKFEKRKRHDKTIKAWIKKFGNNPKYFLNCAVYNHFLTPDQNNYAISSLIEGKKYFNVGFLNFMESNNVYNDFLNSADIVIGMSGGEGWGLPEFHSVGLGKHAVIMNAHAYKDWANSDNAVLVNPSGKIPAYDGVFFNEGAPYNQGNIFDFDEEEFIAGCETAISRVESNRVNVNGLKIKEDFSAEKFLDAVLSHV